MIANQTTSSQSIGLDSFCDGMKLNYFHCVNDGDDGIYYSMNIYGFQLKLMAKDIRKIVFKFYQMLAFPAPKETLCRYHCLVSSSLNFLAGCPIVAVRPLIIAQLTRILDNNEVWQVK